jgi:hypothetical protein
MVTVLNESQRCVWSPAAPALGIPLRGWWPIFTLSGPPGRRDRGDHQRHTDVADELGPGRLGGGIYSALPARRLPPPGQRAASAVAS